MRMIYAYNCGHIVSTLRLAQNLQSPNLDSSSSKDLSNEFIIERWEVIGSIEIRILTIPRHQIASNVLLDAVA